jgi:hypothetical protein
VAAPRCRCCCERALCQGKPRRGRCRRGCSRPLAGGGRRVPVRPARAGTSPSGGFRFSPGTTGPWALSGGAIHLLRTGSQVKSAPGDTDWGGRRPFVGDGDGRLCEDSRLPHSASPRTGSSSRHLGRAGVRPTRTGRRTRYRGPSIVHGLRDRGSVVLSAPGCGAVTGSHLLTCRMSSRRSHGSVGWRFGSRSRRRPLSSTGPPRRGRSAEERPAVLRGFRCCTA